MAVKSASRGVRSAGRQAASSRWLEWLARGGFVARGVIYILIGVLALQIGLGVGGKEAVETVGTVGNTARGIVFGIVGVLLVVAAVTFDPKTAQGSRRGAAQDRPDTARPVAAGRRRPRARDLRDLLILRGALAQRPDRPMRGRAGR
jgi:hypothetical protein